jgi:hypothetical protein
MLNKRYWTPENIRWAAKPGSQGIFLERKRE